MAIRRRTAKQRSGPAMLGAAGAGAVLAYFLDPQLGRTRRVRTKDQVAGMFRRTAKRTERKAEQKAQWAQDRAHGLIYEATHSDQPPENDATLVAKVRSEVLGAEDLQRYTINVDAHDGVVTLRGQVESSADIQRVGDATARVTGVREVESYLHLPGQVPPNKAEVLRRV